MKTFDCIEARRSVRDFESTPVEDAALGKIVTAALCAPVGMRAYDSLCIRCVASKDALSEFLKMARKEMRDETADPIHGAPALIVVAVREVTNVAFANSACMIENMLLAATDLGLGSLYVCGIVNALRDKPEFRQLLQLPEGFAPVGAAAIGYAKDGAPSHRPIPNKISQVQYI